jgi:AAA domain
MINVWPPAWQPIGFNDFLSIDLPPRKMLLSPILPERSLAMLYAPRGVGKTMLSLSIGVAVASGGELLRWSAAERKRVLYVDGEMPVVSLQERLRAISRGLNGEIPNEGFQIWRPTTPTPDYHWDQKLGGFPSSRFWRTSICSFLTIYRPFVRAAVKVPAMPGFRCRIGP